MCAGAGWDSHLAVKALKKCVFFRIRAPRSGSGAGSSPFGGSSSVAFTRLMTDADRYAIAAYLKSLPRTASAAPSRPLRTR
jgi:hypothetical protein